MSEPRIVSPQEAAVLRDENFDHDTTEWGLAHTVATEPDRIRAAVVKALRKFAETFDDAMADREAAAIENGADL